VVVCPGADVVVEDEVGLVTVVDDVVEVLGIVAVLIVVVLVVVVLVVELDVEVLDVEVEVVDDVEVVEEVEVVVEVGGGPDWVKTTTLPSTSDARQKSTMGHDTLLNACSVPFTSFCTVQFTPSNNRAFPEESTAAQNVVAEHEIPSMVFVASTCCFDQLEPS